MRRRDFLRTLGGAGLGAIFVPKYERWFRPNNIYVPKAIDLMVAGQEGYIVKSVHFSAGLLSPLQRTIELVAQIPHRLDVSHPSIPMQKRVLLETLVTPGEKQSVDFPDGLALQPGTVLSFNVKDAIDGKDQRFGPIRRLSSDSLEIGDRVTVQGMNNDAERYGLSRSVISFGRDK